MQPVVYLPVELKHRELDSRLMTASHLLDAGATVVVGQQWGIFQNCAAWPQGIILFKTVNDIQAHNMANFRMAGHIVAATDEEVLTCLENFCIAFSPRAAENCDIFFAQSEFHKADVEKDFPQLRGKIFVSGNPRVEITSKNGRQAFQAQVDEIKRDVGPFILLNSNFASVNSVWGDLQKVFSITVHAGVIKKDDPNAVEIFNSWMKWEAQNRNDMLAFLQWAANNVRDRKIVIRPHPGEKAEFWHQYVNNHPNVLVKDKTAPLPWIMASDLLVHTSCTTGLEAALLDKPVLNIEAWPDPALNRITSLINPTFKTVEEAIAAASRFLTDGTGPLAGDPTYKATLEKYFPGFHAGGPAKAIAEQCIAQLAAHDAKLHGPVDWTLSGKKYHANERQPLMIEKMSITPQDMVVAFDEVRRRLGATGKVALSIVDDSLFVLQRAS